MDCAGVGFGRRGFSYDVAAKLQLGERGRATFELLMALWSAVLPSLRNPSPGARPCASGLLSFAFWVCSLVKCRVREDAVALKGQVRGL
jgi:hypothetical protein